MILGIGVDIVAIRRFEGIWARHGVQVYRHVLSDGEVELAQTRRDVPRFLAKRWAAKEAIGKAFGCGLRAPLLMPHIEIRSDPLGRPEVGFLGPAAAYVDARLARVHLSISDEKDTVVAFAVVEKKPAG